jgi:hypothetical protein
MPQDPPSPVTKRPDEGPITRADIERLFEQLNRLERLIKAIESMLTRGGL